MTRAGQGKTEQGKPGFWATGYTVAELDDAQARFALRFPPDLVALLRDRRPAQGRPGWCERSHPPVARRRA